MTGRESASPLDLAFLGCGQAARMHARTLGSVDPSVRLHFASRAGERAEAYRRELDGRGSFSSYRAAIEAPEVDAVVVTTPPSRHLDLALGALEAGKDVIVEKPPFPSSEDLARARDAAEAAGRRLMVAENYFYKPLLGRLRELLAERAVGEVLVLHVNALKRQANDGWRDDPERAGGGALFEGGIHWVDFMASLGLTVESVVARRPGAERGPGMDRSAVLLFEYAEGPVGALYYSWEVPSLFRGLRLSKIYGREGSITFESNGLAVAVRGRKKRLLFPGLRDISGYRAMFRDLLGALRTGEEPRYTLALAERDLRLVEEAYRSMGEGREG